MRIKKTPDFKKIKKNVDKKIYKALQTSGNMTILALKKRVKRGVDSKGGQFKSLDKTYQKRKAKVGKKAMFEYSGDMLRSITHETKKKNILRFYFDDGDENDKAHYNINKYKRDFFELSDKEIGKIKDRISNSLIDL